MDLPTSTRCASSPTDALLTLVRLVESADRRMNGHGIRTARYAVPLGHAVGFSPAQLNDLCLASLLHDIGVLTLPEHILEKDGPLSDEEYALVQSHSRAGAELLAPIPVLCVASLWIAHHHERWDGFGYPYGLRGTLIPLGARVLAIADTFDSLTSPQPYRPALDTETAMRLLHELAGSQLDPELVPVFTRLVSAQPASCAASNAGGSIDEQAGGLVPSARGRGFFRSSGEPRPTWRSEGIRHDTTISSLPEVPRDAVGAPWLDLGVPAMRLENHDRRGAPRLTRRQGRSTSRLRIVRGRKDA